ncbi:MAG: hypothetical protein LBT88_04755 [Oscillospiraceae bacterium]|jgi:hypothetical protein|nr:hypothetical protein [Oscillospiraceae bacterium]
MQWLYDINVLGTDKYEWVEPFKDQWIEGYAVIIRSAAEKYDIPPELLAGVLHIEVGGEPFIFDDIAYILRSFRIMPDRDKDTTSFGNASVQVRTAAVALGYDYDKLTGQQRKDIINTLNDPVQSVFVAALYLSQLKYHDYPFIDGKDLTDEQIAIIANRYNQGTRKALEEMEPNYIILLKLDKIRKLISDKIGRK